jgi:hypothetical protein
MSLLEFYLQNKLIFSVPELREYTKINYLEHFIRKRSFLTILDIIGLYITQFFDWSKVKITKTKLSSVAWVRDRTVPTELPPLVGELSANFCGYKVPRGQHDGSLRPYSRLSRPEPLLFLPSSSSVVLTKLSGPRSRLTTSQKIW